MPASPATTKNLSLPRFAADDSTRIWEHLNGLADKIDAHFGEWKSYTPTWSQSNGTGLAVGSGSIVGRYSVQGKTVMGHIRLQRAADSHVGTGYWIFSLPPVAPRAWNLVGGSLALTRQGQFFGGSVFPASSTSVGAIVGDLGRLSNAVPLSASDHADGDWYSLSFFYEAA